MMIVMQKCRLAIGIAMYFRRVARIEEGIWRLRRL
jgi:hypothetical protein